MSTQRKTLFMATTAIKPAKTAAEITQLLAAGGAEQINSTYSAGRITGLTFSIQVKGMPMVFALPVRSEALFAYMKKYGSLVTGGKIPTTEQAERIAWRQLLRWVEIQLVLIQTGMAQVAEVFLPYIVDASGRSFYAAIEGSGFRGLSAGSSFARIGDGE